MSELKPCPFCGGEAHITLEQAMWFIECENEDCGALMGFEAEVVSRIEAVRDWNHRAQPANELLTLKQPEIVRCKDCKYWNHKYTTVGECEKLADRDQEGGAQFDCDTDDDDFCSYGERKEGAQCTTN